MQFEVIERLVPRKFVVLNDVEFELRKLVGCLQQFLYDTRVDDHYGDYSLRDYELDYYYETKGIILIV